MGWRGIKHDFVLDEDERGEFCMIPVGRSGEYFAKVDIDDFEKVRPYRWHLNWIKLKTRMLTYAARCDGRDGEGNRRFLKMHRQIMEVTSPHIQVDHINGDGLDNRKHNLRIATGSQNNWNQRARVGGTSGYKGVSWYEHLNGWGARIQYLGESIWLGSFAKNVVDGIDLGEVAAAKAYDRAAVKYFGVFARLNFPPFDAAQDKEEKMGYVLGKDEIKRATALVKELNSRECMSINSWLMGQSVEDLELLCRFVGCNISGLARGLANYTQTKGTENEQRID